MCFCWPKNQWVAPEPGLEGFTVSRRSRSEVKSKGPLLFFWAGVAEGLFDFAICLKRRVFFLKFWRVFLLFNLKQYCPTLICLVRVLFSVESCSFVSYIFGLHFICSDGVFRLAHQPDFTLIALVKLDVLWNLLPAEGATLPLAFLLSAPCTLTFFFEYRIFHISDINTFVRPSYSKDTPSTLPSRIKRCSLNYRVWVRIVIVLIFICVRSAHLNLKSLTTTLATTSN